MSDTMEKKPSTEEIVSGLRAQTEFVRAVAQAERDKARLDVWGAKLFRSINNAMVYIAGTLVAGTIGFGAIVAIAWLATQLKNLLWGVG